MGISSKGAIDFLLLKEWIKYTQSCAMKIIDGPTWV